VNIRVLSMIWGVMGLCGGALAAEPDAPNDPRNSTAQRIHDQIEKLSELRRQRAGLAAEHQRQLSQTHRQIDRLRSELSAAQAQLEQLQKSVTDQESALQGHRRMISDSTATLATMAKLARPLAESLRQRIEQGIPFRRAERLGAVNAALAGLGSDTPEAQSEGLAALWSALGETSQLATTLQMWNEPVTLGDRRIHAYQIRVGLVCQLLAGEDGETFAMAGPASAGQWKTDVDEASAQAIRAALSILQQRTPPRLTAIPLLPSGRSGARQ
jgi:TolA-binding protein